MAAPHTSPLKRLGLAWLITLLAPLACSAQMRAGQIDVFMGVDLKYRDIYLNGRPFDFLINLTPGVKWRLQNRWEVAAGAYVPILNQYGYTYSEVLLNNLTVSKQFAAFDRLKVKATAGIFGGYRYGLDAKAMFIVNRWLGFVGEIGWVGFIQVSKSFDIHRLSEVVGMAGPVVYLHPWNVELGAKAGRYLYGDWGGVADAMRHFKHFTFGVFGAYSQNIGWNAGFKAIVMLPPYKAKRRKVNFRPASNFRLTYNCQANSIANKLYMTDPEENEREGWFDRDLLPWGQNLMEPDLVYKNEADSARKEVAR